MNEEQNINGALKDWKWERLGDACSIVMGQSPPSTSYNTDGIGLPFFQGKAEFTELHPIVEKWCTEPNKIALPHDVLLSVRAPVGTTNIADQECCIGRGLAAIRFDNYKYAFYFLRSIQQQLDSKGTGTTFRAISGETIRETLFPVPPKKVQQQIVSKIEELFSEVDKGNEELKTAQQQLKVYRQAVLKWAFEGKLTNEDVIDGELRKGWKVINLSEITSLITKGASPKWQGINYVTDASQVLFVTSENVRENYIDISQPKYLELSFNEKQKRSILRKGDILLNIVGASIGRAAIYNHNYNANINQAVAVIRLTHEASNVFISYFLNSNKAFSYYNLNKVDFARANLSLADVSNIEIELPPLEEQQQIVQEIESRLSVCDKIEETITNSLKQSEVLRQSILKKAFEGRLV